MKKFLISEEDAQAILEQFLDKPYREVFHLCEILRNLIEVPDIDDKLQRHHQFLLKKGLWDEFLGFNRWLIDMDDSTGQPPDPTDP